MAKKAEQYIKECCPILLKRGGSRAPQDQAAMVRELRLIRHELPVNHSMRMLAEFNFAPKNRMGWRQFKKEYEKKGPPGYAFEDGVASVQK